MKAIYRTIEHKTDGKTFVKRPIGFVYSEEELSVEEAWKIKKQFKSTDNSTYTKKIGTSMLIFDFYVVEDLHFFKRIGHYLRKFVAAVAGKVGINTNIIIVETT